MKTICLITVFLLGSTPAFSSDVKTEREAIESKTNSIILDRIEAERLEEEKKRIKSLGAQPATATVEPSPALKKSYISRSLWKFTRKTFISLGLGSVQYPGVKNINSSSVPAWFFSFGGYVTDSMIIDFTLFQSQHFIELSNSNFLEGVYQPSAGMQFKYSPLDGRVKPYFGLAGVYKKSRWFRVDSKGNYIKNPYDNIARKKWYEAFDAGLSAGIDVALGNRIGVNLDLRYQINLYTEIGRQAYRRKIRNNYNRSVAQPLDERNSLIFSLNTKFYFH